MAGEGSCKTSGMRSWASLLKKQVPWDTAEGRRGSLQVCTENSFMQPLVSLAPGLPIHIPAPVRMQIWGWMGKAASVLLSRGCYMAGWPGPKRYVGELGLVTSLSSLNISE